MRWPDCICIGNMQTRARFFLLVDLREFFSDLGSGGRKKIKKL